jgi:serine protease AprX
MDQSTHPTVCPLCHTPATREELGEACWLSPGAAALLQHKNPGWTLHAGACHRCVQRAQLAMLLEQGTSSQHEKIQAAWPLDAETAFGVLPTPLRLHADPRYTGKGQVIAFLDSGFFPHPDLTRPRNRIRAWVDATTRPVTALRFGRDEQPRWPDWDALEASQWHGLMTSTVAAGNGLLSHGLYRGLASEADVVLVKVRGANGRIGNENIMRGLRWLQEYGPELGVRIVSVSVAGRPSEWSSTNPIDAAVADLVREGITVVTAAGNSGERRLVPPATAPEAVTVGGLDDQNSFNPEDIVCWHSNYGEAADGMSKPELVAPSIWVVAPILPGTLVAEEAEVLFRERHTRSLGIERRIAEMKLVTPHYQHVDGTSFAAPLVASAVACMLQANPSLSPFAVKEWLAESAQPVEGVDRERQGSGALAPARAIGMALRADGGPLIGVPLSPSVETEGVRFFLYAPEAETVHIQGSWDDWSLPGLRAEQIARGVWCAGLPEIAPGHYQYRFVLNGHHYLDDPDNPRKRPNGVDGFNSLLDVPHLFSSWVST